MQDIGSKNKGEEQDQEHKQPISLIDAVEDLFQPIHEIRLVYGLAAIAVEQSAIMVFFPCGIVGAVPARSPSDGLPPLRAGPELKPSRASQPQGAHWRFSRIFRRVRQCAANTSKERLSCIGADSLPNRLGQDEVG